MRLSRYRRFSIRLAVFCLIAVCAVTVILTFSHKNTPPPQASSWRSNSDQVLEYSKKQHSSRSEKWIVITTIAPPTEDIKFIASLKGWRVVVVGDVKTPTNWNFTNCDFLDIKKQKELNFYTTKLVPENSYTRKNIGYLYAIQHGAKFIYETDDDNRPSDRLQRFDYGPKFQGLEFAGRHLFNPYHHFGQSTLWPRGFPLSGIAEKSSRLYRMSQRMNTGLIQQGLVNGDPDMDAIFRLTRKRADTDLDVHFDPVAPAVSVPPGVFSPFNSQNTLFHYGTFWGLLLPTSTTMRVCDIWRGYWAQRLLWEIGGRLAFYPPNAYQKRNSHSYLQDAQEEEQIYKTTENLIDFLAKWTCQPKFSFFRCVEMLTSDLVAAGFLAQIDIDLTRAWLADLSSVGYKEPSRKPFNGLHKLYDTLGNNRIFGNETVNICRQRPVNPNLAQAHNETNVIFYPVEQRAPVLQPRNQPPLPQLFRHLSMAEDVCPYSNLFTYKTYLKYALKNMNFFDDILLIISFNYPDFYSNIRYLEAAYRPVFSNIVYCGPDHFKFQKAVKGMPHLQGLSFIEADTSCGYLVYSCMLQALKIGYNVTGYMRISDDSLINPWNFVGMNKSRVWITKELVDLFHPQTQQWYWWQYPSGKYAFELVVKDVIEKIKPLDIDAVDGLVKFLVKTTTGNRQIMKGMSDVYYIPRRLERVAKHYLKIFYSRSLFLEIAIPTFLYGLEPASVMEAITGRALRAKERKTIEIWDVFNSSSHFIHPVKFSSEFSSEMFCSKFMPVLMKNLYGRH